MSKKTTIYDVAEEADVSLATVSRVINGSDVVRQQTKERVLEAIRKLDFKPNAVARGLATSKSTTIAVIFPQSIFARVKDMIGGIGDTGRTLDYSLTMYTTDELGDGNPIEEVIEKIVKSRADGVVLFNNDNIRQEIALCQKYNMPTAVVGYEVADDNVTSVYADVHDIGKSLTEKFFAAGKDKVAFVRPQQNLVDMGQLESGLREAYDSAGKNLPDDAIMSVSTQYEEAYAFFMDYFKDHKPDAVIAGYDKEAVAILQAAQDSGYNVPDDVEVVGMVDSTYALISRPKLTSVHLPVYDMGAVAVRLITKMLNNEEIDDPKVLMHYTLITRDSTKSL